MKSYRLLVFVFIAGALLASCSSSVVEPEPFSGSLPEDDAIVRSEIQEPVLAPTKIGQSSEIISKQVTKSSGDQTRALWPDGEVQLDEQGFVEVAVTPLNLNTSDETLNFNVGLNTHSVDLSMDLAPLATLEADNGLGVQAILWDAPRGGHHVSGVLSFPSIADGAKLLEGASHLTLTIHNVDAPERSFTWSLTG